MAETTENYGLLKPEETDYYSIEIQNENMDAIDAALKAQADGIATKASADGLAAHTSNTAVHVTTQEKVAWDGKADSAALTAHTSNTTTHITAAERTAWNSKADAVGMTSHTGNTTVHITAGERSSWNAAVPNTRKINNKILSADIMLVATDIGALPSGDVVTVATANKILRLNTSGQLPASITGNAVTATTSSNTSSIAGAITLSTAVPTTVLGAGKLWGRY